MSFAYPEGPPVLEDFSLAFREQELTAILGPNGSGKTTVLKLLRGLLTPQSGELWQPPDEKFRVGYVFQNPDYQLFAEEVWEEVAFGVRLLGLSAPEVEQRVGAALALAPKLLVLDEPTTDLDPLRVEELLASLDHLSRTRDLTLIFLGEDLRLARLCTRIVLLNEGEILADGAPESILREVELLRTMGLAPPELPALFHDLGQATLPLSLEEAVSQARALGWTGHPDAATPKDSGQGSLPHPDEILALRRVSFAYPEGPPVLEDFSLAFREQELTAILGPNGSGKTTVLKLLRGLLTPQSGELWQPPDEKFRVGYVFQNPDYQLFAEEVWEEVAFGVRLLGLSAPEVEQRVEAALTRVHLLDRARDDPFSLTKGQRQRLAVAGVLALAPQVIILDEPTTGLDHREQQDLLGLVRELHAQGHAVIMVTHSMWAAATYARRLVVLLDGRVLLDGPPREVLADAAGFDPSPPGSPGSGAAQPGPGLYGPDPGGVSGSGARPGLNPGLQMNRKVLMLVSCPTHNL